MCSAWIQILNKTVVEYKLWHFGAANLVLAFLDENLRSQLNSTDTPTAAAKWRIFPCCKSSSFLMCMDSPFARAIFPSLENALRDMLHFSLRLSTSPNEHYWSSAVIQLRSLDWYQSRHPQKQQKYTNSCLALLLFYIGLSHLRISTQHHRERGTLFLCSISLLSGPDLCQCSHSPSRLKRCVPPPSLLLLIIIRPSPFPLCLTRHHCTPHVGPVAFRVRRHLLSRCQEPGERSPCHMGCVCVCVILIFKSRCPS